MAIEAGQCSHRGNSQGARSRPNRGVHMTDAITDQATPEQAALREVFYGQGGIASCKRVILNAPPQNLILVIENQTREALTIGRKAGIDDVEILDQLTNSLNARNISESCGQGEIQAAMERGIKSVELQT